MREIRLLLDRHGYNEVTLQSAERNCSNRDIAASIIGHIRRAALGEALIPYGKRVDAAVERILARQQWTPAQRKWIERLGNQLVHEVVIDRDFLQRAAAPSGGLKLLEAVFNQQLDEVVSQLRTAVWEQVA